jgi:hypothetical protein
MKLNFVSRVIYTKDMKQKTFSTLFSSLLIALAIFLVPSFAFVNAQSNTNGSSDKVQDGLNAIGSAYPAGAKAANYDITNTLHKVIDWALYLAAIAAVVMIIVGGYMYIFSAGNAASAGKGRTTMLNALIGLTLIVLSYLIVQIVYHFLTT